MNQADSTVIFGEEIINCCHTVLNGSELSITEAWDILTVQDKMKKRTYHVLHSHQLDF